MKAQVRVQNRESGTVRFLIPPAQPAQKRELLITRLKYYDYFEADLTSGELRVKLDEISRDALREIVAYFCAKYVAEFCRGDDAEACAKEIERLVAESVAGVILHLLRTWIQTIAFYILK